MTDFGHAQVLDRLLVYERRLESSLYRTMAQLRREREARTAAAVPGEASHSEDCSPAGQEFIAPAKLASFGANPTLEGASGAKCPGSSEGSDFTLQTSRFEPAKITPYGVTTNAPAEEPSCETKPILPDARAGQTAWRKEVRSDLRQEEAARTG